MSTLTLMVVRFLSAVCVLCSVELPQANGDGHAARQILEASTKAMAPPIQYSMESRGSKVVISQAVLADGTTALRVDTEAPVEKYSLWLTGDTFEVYPNHGVLIDLAFLTKHLNEVRQTAQDAVAALGNVDRERVSVIGIKTEGGRDCFEIETAREPSFRKAIVDAFNFSNNLVPARERFFIAKDSYDLAATEQFSANGELIGRSVLSKIDHTPAFSDNLFLPPDGMKVMKPETMREYFAAIQVLFSSRTDAAQGRSAEILRENAKTVALLNERYEKEAVAIASGARHTAVKLDHLPSGATRARVRLLLFNVILLAVIAIAFYLRKQSAGRHNK
jgi:hypothetical protein